MFASSQRSLESMGVPLPGETALVTAAVLAARGDVSIELIIALAALGAIVGDNVGFLLGRRFGRRLLLHPGPLLGWRQSLVRDGSAYFAKRGTWAVFLGRWVTVGRVAVAWIAGADRMPWGRFALANAAGSVGWATTVGLVAYRVGSAGATWIAVGGVALALVGAIPVVLRRRHAAAAS